MLIDQHLHSPDAIYVDFFERPAATTSMLAALALRTGATVLPVFALPLPGGRYKLIYEHPVPPPDPDSPDAIREFTQRCTDVLEMYVRRYPSVLALDAPALARRAVAGIDARDVPARTARHRSRRVSDVPSRVVVLAPNWLGDVVMALPAIASFRALWPPPICRWPRALLSRRCSRWSTALTLSFPLEGRGGWHALLSGGPDRDTLANGRFDVAVLLPNSFHAALLARRAGISERWGYRTDLRGPLLTRAIPRRPSVHHGRVLPGAGDRARRAFHATGGVVAARRRRRRARGRVADVPWLDRRARVCCLRPGGRVRLGQAMAARTCRARRGARRAGARGHPGARRCPGRSRNRRRGASRVSEPPAGPPTAR